MPETLLRYRNREDTAANWASVNPVLLSGELGRETDTNKFKFGDGATAWAALPYAVSASAGGYEFTQSSAAATWTVNHNLGRWPSSVRVLSAGGVEIMADVADVTINQLIITFAAPRTGSARII